MIDCGSDISIIKANKVNLNRTVFPNDTCNITGIGHTSEKTIASTYSNILIDGNKLPQKLHIVKNDFPIPTDGILGRDFFTAYKCQINYDSWILHIGTANASLPIVDNLHGKFIIPPRCEIIKQVRIPTIPEPMVAVAQEITPGIFYANSIIDKDNTYLKFLNTTESNAVIPINFMPKLEPLKNFQSVSDSNNQNTKDRNKQLLSELNIQHPDPIVKSNLEHLCTEFSDIFSLNNDMLTCNNFYEQQIFLENPKPTYIKNYRTPESQRSEINRQVEKMLREDVIQHSKSPFNSPVLLVPKKASNNQNNWRLVVDFRQLNKNIMADKFPLPRIDDILDQLGRARYFSTLDLRSGFHQIPIAEACKKYTAFSTDTGHYEFNRLPFGLNVSPNSFQRMMTIALSGLSPECAFLYIDDVIVTGCSIKHHLANLKKVFQRMRDFNLKLNPSKCNFFKSEVTFLGHHISANGIQQDPSKCSIIFNYPVPKNADETRRFVALCNYYRRFIPNFASIANPLNKLLRKNTKFIWSIDCQNSFDVLKRQLTSPRILQFPDYRKTFILTTDASKLACGAVLAQLHGDRELPVAYASRAFTRGEANKSTIEQELTAIHWAINYFRPYLYGRRFIVKTDHRPLVYLFSLKNPTSKLSRMRLELEEYDFSIEYIKGTTNAIADALSRIEVDIESLKSMYIITRSMSKRQQKQRDTSVPTQEPDQLNVIETFGIENAFGLHKLSFISNNSSNNNLSMILFKKNYSKGILKHRI